MPTIIDSLLVTLGLDAKGFKQGKEQVDKGLKETGKTGEESFKKITKSAAEFFAVIGGTYEIKRFIQNQIEANAALQRLSQNLNESAQRISAWSNAAELAGGSAQGLQGTMSMLGRAQTELLLTGQSHLIPYMSALGLSMTDAAGRALPVSQMLANIGDRLQKIGNRQTAFNMGQMMGIDPGTLNLMLESNGELIKTIKRVSEHTAVTKEQAAEAVKLSVAMGSVTQNFTAFGRELLQDASPALEKVFALMYRFGDWLRENKGMVETFLTVVAVGIGAITVAALPLNLTVAAIVAFGAALSLAWQDYKVWENGGNSLFNWAPAINLAKEAFSGLEIILKSILYRAGKVGETLYYLSHGEWGYAKESAEGIVTGKTAPGAASDGSDRGRFIAAAANKLGVPPAAIDAQLRLETGANGSKTVGNYNYGNIKAGAGYGGETVTKSVMEYGKNGGSFQDVSKFRSYSSPEEAAADYAATIAKKFPGAVGKKNAADFARGLQAGGYATDPDYVRKIATIAFGIRGASSAAAGAGASRSAALQGGATGGNRSVETNIGAITVNTQATNADAMAKDLKQSLNYLFASQANYGLM